MAKKKAVQSHQVKAAVKNLDLTKAGTSIELNVYAAEEKIGTVEIGRGSLRWYGKSKKNPKIIPWSKLADWMESK
jgi:hypothetical protein